MENRWSMIQRMVKIHMNGMKLLDTILLGETDNVRMEVAVVCYIIWKKCILLKTHSFCHTKLIILFHSQRLSLSVMYRLPILDIPFYDTLDKHLTLYSWEKKAYTLWVFNLWLIGEGNVQWFWKKTVMYFVTHCPHSHHLVRINDSLIPLVECSINISTWQNAKKICSGGCCLMY